MKKILVVEDEIAISMVLKAYLEREGFNVVQVYDGLKAIPVFEETEPDLILLDVMLPGKEGWDILKEIREEDTCPVIMLTALTDVDYRLSGFKSGADDYISKPFVAEEVVARVHAVLRRSSSVVAEGDHVHEFGSLTIDDQSYMVHLDGEEINLTPRDLSLLIFFAKHPNQIFTREQLLDQVWGMDYDGSDRAVDLAIKRIRKAIDAWPVTEGEIKTLRGLGYQLSVYEN
ncbi:response regulator transcription factor [Peribacillus simplex]|uniref:Response regulator transcription factor n=1 Tax=Peribacillus simplex TaxID=1478 RepID=A0AAW7INM0_9BACI|nr:MULTISPECIES: response regulator transcription factor [Peribacillus]AMM91984.1 transcriptional regulator [Peribacillus simplex]MDF9763040.1 DNA-binding response OmpR family regulator [Peribacillus simplex]MDM5296014.1 response regulator transcription factor [Peribacillus simplex]MDM5455019.1 response regulator transcription factor [Peribacillus simplex]MDV7764057.1 response regulator transcription factor [Peribacillus sp. CSMR9]